VNKEQQATECLSTQEDSSFFDSSHLATVPKTYDGGKAPSTPKIDQLKQQIAQNDRERKAREAKISDLRY
jgi:hypothetical protein